MGASTQAMAAGVTQSHKKARNLTSKYAHLRDTDKGLILQLAANGQTQAEIAAIIGCNQSSVSDFLRRVKHPATVVQQVLKSHELDASAEWARAMKVAADRGDHRPARELIETANPELRPQPVNSGAGVGVQVIIGMPGQPVELPVIGATFAPALNSARGETQLDHSAITPASHKGDSDNNG